MRRKDRTPIDVLAKTCLATCLCAAPGSHASVRPARVASAITVTNCLDSGPGSLRDAIAQTDGVNITTVDLTHLACSVITLTSGRLATTHSLYLEGPGPDLLTIDGNHADRIIDEDGASPFIGLHIYGITLTRGYATSAGGCLYSASPVGLNQTVVTGCRVAGIAGNSLYQGGGIFVKGDTSIAFSKITDNEVYTALGTAAGGGIAVVDGHVNLGRSTISGNRVVTAGPEQVAFSGGAKVGGSMYMYDSTIADNSITGVHGNVGRGGGMTVYGALQMQGCTISGNAAGAIGGLIVGGSETTPDSFILQSTISGNHAATVGGAALFGSMTIANSTIAFNSGDPSFGAGLYLANGSFDLESSIISNNGDGASTINVGVYDIAALTGANNLIGSSGATPLPPGTISSDPHLLPLADNGGLTLTHALAADSPAIDAGNNTMGEIYDQRDAPYPRLVGTAPDIGAIESTHDTIFSNGFD